MRNHPVVLAIVLGALSGCVRPGLERPGLESPAPTRQEGADLGVVRSYFDAINAKNRSDLSDLLAEDVKVTLGPKSWGKATELSNRAEAWTRDPNYTVEITSLRLEGDLVQARVMVTRDSHGTRVRQEIRNAFKVQHHQIVLAILSP